MTELPHLLPPTEGARERMLTAIQAAMEDATVPGGSCMLCGSQVAVMKALMRSGSGLGLLEALSTRREMTPNDLAGSVGRTETSLPAS